MRPALGTSFVRGSPCFRLAALLLPLGAVGDRQGHKPVLLVGLAVFAVASAGAAPAPSAGLMLAARLLGGVGAAMIMPVTLAVITSTFPAQERVRASRRGEQGPSTRRSEAYARQLWFEADPSCPVGLLDKSLAVPRPAASVISGWTVVQVFMVTVIEECRGFAVKVRLVQHDAPHGLVDLAQGCDSELRATEGRGDGAELQQRTR
ncbi:MFS transporter [Amycolatopsis keratiniphila]